jgi:hypothetical protein
LKTFLTQIGPALPLMSDPPVICFWKWIRWKDYEVPKNRNLESVSAKIIMFLLPKGCLPTCCTHMWTPTHESSLFLYPCRTSGPGTGTQRMHPPVPHDPV